MSVVKTSRPFLVTLLTLAASASAAWWLRADDTLPKAPTAARYDAMAERSPFTAPTAATPAPTAAPVAAGPHWWDQMFITSLMERGGVYFAALVDQTSKKHYVLEINKVDPDSQLLLASVQWNDRLDQTTVTVSKGAETAPPLRFDASASTAAPGATAFSTSPPPNLQAPFTPPPRTAPINPMTGPPGFTGTPPPPPPSMPNVVRRTGPIGANPPANPANGARKGVQQPGGGQPRRIIVPNNADDGE